MAIRIFFHDTNQLHMLLAPGVVLDDRLFLDDFIKWAEEQEGYIQFVSTTDDGYVCLPVSDVKNSTFGESYSNSDSIMIENENTAMLFKLTWL